MSINISSLGGRARAAACAIPLVAMLVTAAVALTPAAQAAPAESSTSDLWRFSDGSRVVGASSRLVRTSNGVSLNQHTQAPSGHAVTVWWVVFNNPDQCDGAPGSPFRCAEPDLFNPDVQGSVQFAAGHLVGNAGAYTIASHLAEGDTAGCDLEPLGGPGFLCAGLIDAQRADVHLVVRSHGPGLPEYYPTQFRSFAGACTPESSLGLGDGPATCTDMQFAVHETS